VVEDLVFVLIHDGKHTQNLAWTTSSFSSGNSLHAINRCVWTDVDVYMQRSISNHLNPDFEMDTSDWRAAGIGHSSGDACPQPVYSNALGVLITRERFDRPVVQEAFDEEPERGSEGSVALAAQSASKSLAPVSRQ